MLLLDTNILIPWLAGDSIPEPVVEQIQTDGAYVSPVSIWEIWIKVSIGKLRLETESLVAEVDTAQLSWLNVTPAHAEAIKDLPLLHRDPFDRLLLAQASAEGCKIVTTDALFADYLPDTWVVAK